MLGKRTEKAGARLIFTELRGSLVHGVHFLLHRLAPLRALERTVVESLRTAGPPTCSTPAAPLTISLPRIAGQGPASGPLDDVRM